MQKNIRSFLFRLVITYTFQGKTLQLLEINTSDFHEGFSFCRALKPDHSDKKNSSLVLLLEQTDGDFIVLIEIKAIDDKWQKLFDAKNDIKCE